MTASQSIVVEISQLMARYADAVMRRDAEDWGATWAEDAVWNLSGNEVAGREAIVQLWLGAMGGFPMVIHTAFPPAVRVIDDDHARGRCTVREILRMPDDSAREIVGVYHDEFVRTDEGWRFASRRFDVLLARPLDLSEADIAPWPADTEPDFLRG